MATKVMPFTQTTVGKKMLMTVTGVAMFGFVIVHMLGNLQAWPFLGGEKALNHYAHLLHSVPKLLWGARLVMLASVGIHMWAAIVLILRNLKARGGSIARYKHPAPPQAATIFSRTMVFTGPILASYIIYHVAHLTLGWVHGHFIAGTEHVYHNLVTGFQSPIHSLIYIASMLVLGMHLAHAGWSIFQTVGLNRLSWSDRIKGAALGLAGFIMLLDISIPVGVLAGLIK